jgi:cell division protein FtsZ
MPVCEDAFRRADDVLHNAVAGIAEIINVPGLVNVDFADVKTVMGEQGKAMMGIGEAAGLDRARLAAEQAVASPLLDGVDLSGARGVIVNITANRSLKLRETNEVINTIKAFCAEDATIIHGTVFDEDMGDKLRVTVVATGIGRKAARPQLVPKVEKATGTHDVVATTSADYDTPTVWRDPRHRRPRGSPHSRKAASSVWTSRRSSAGRQTEGATRGCRGSRALDTAAARG